MLHGSAEVEHEARPPSTVRCVIRHIPDGVRQGGNVRRTPVLRAGAILLGLALVAAGCGGDDKSGNAAASTTAAPATSAAAAATTAGSTATTGAGAADVDGRVGGAVGQAAGRDRQAHQGQQVGQVGRRQDADRARGLHDRPDQVPGGLVRHRGPDRHDDQDRPGDRRSRARSPTTATIAKGHRRRSSTTTATRASSRTSPARPARSTTSPRTTATTPARTIPIVDELLDSEKVFAIWTLGSPNTLKTYDKINQRCVPQPVSHDRPPGLG